MVATPTDSAILSNLCWRRCRKVWFRWNIYMHAIYTTLGILLNSTNSFYQSHRQEQLPLSALNMTFEPICMTSENCTLIGIIL